jgi:hypothetical protein
MREKQEVVDRYIELRDRYLKERKDAYLARMPINCVHNVRLHVPGKGYFRFCQNPLVIAQSKQGMFLCHDPETAKRCRVFSGKNTAEMVEQTFDDIMRSPARCGSEYPKMAMLIWFLQEFESRGRAARLGQAIRRLLVSIWNIITIRWW